MVIGSGLRLVLLGTLLNLMSIAFGLDIGYNSFFVAILGMFIILFSFFINDKYTYVKILLLGVNIILLSILASILSGPNAVGPSVVAVGGFIISLFAFIKKKQGKVREERS